MTATRRTDLSEKMARSGRHGVLSIRLRDDLYLKLKSAAATNQRSISEEMEFRIELSVRDDRPLP